MKKVFCKHAVELFGHDCDEVEEIAKAIRDGIEPEKTKPVAKATHTPGPWKFITGSIVGRDREDHEHVRHIVELRKHVLDKDGSEFQANARLIAAAPELLEQLKIAQQWIEFAKEHCALGTKAGGDWYIDQDNIRKAIARAEGNE